MDKKTLIITLIIVLIVVLSYFFFAWRTQAPTIPNEKTISTKTPNNGLLSPNQNLKPNQVLITYSNNGFSPNILRIKKGTRVIFTNQSSQLMWPASAIHPTHTVYPGSDIKKCGTTASAEIFDSCQGIAPNQTWSFEFNEVGSWKYHNHLRPNHTGTLIVE